VAIAEDRIRDAHLCIKDVGEAIPAAHEAMPASGPATLLSLNVKEWEKAVGLKP
jgi:hypothetical protein